MDEDFEKWLDEIEIYTTRRDRFEDAVYRCSLDEMTKWLELAWISGRKTMGVPDK